MKKKLNAAVIGLGVGARHAFFLNSFPKVNFVSLCDFDKNKINKYKKKFKKVFFTTDANKIFKDPKVDIVVIASYDNFHSTHILNAIKYNKHFFVEKPFCLNISELEKINFNLKNNNNIIFSSNLILRNNPTFLDLKKKFKTIL